MPRKASVALMYCKRGRMMKRLSIRQIQRKAQATSGSLSGWEAQREGLGVLAVTAVARIKPIEGEGLE